MKRFNASPAVTPEIPLHKASKCLDTCSEYLYHILGTSNRGVMRGRRGRSRAVVVSSEAARPPAFRPAFRPATAAHAECTDVRQRFRSGN